MSKVISLMLWFASSALSNFLTKFAPNQSQFARTRFPALDNGYMYLLQVGSFRCLCLFWLARNMLSTATATAKLITRYMLRLRRLSFFIKTAIVRILSVTIATDSAMYTVSQAMCSVLVIRSINHLSEKKANELYQGELFLCLSRYV